MGVMRNAYRNSVGKPKTKRWIEGRKEGREALKWILKELGVN
jgi:hypothetical protein